MLRILELIKEKPRGSPTGLKEPEEVALAQAQEVAECTQEFLTTRGWCLWKCSRLGEEVVAIVRDESVNGVPGGYPVYTETEIAELFKGDIKESTLRLVHEAKKLVGAKVISNEEAN